MDTASAMKATWSTTWVQLSSLLSRTPNEAETVRPLAQMASKPVSSTIRAESPSWASMRKAISGRVNRRRRWLVVRMSGQAHLSLDGAGQGTERRLQLGDDREVVVADHVEHLDGDPLGPPRRGQLAGLPVIFGALVAAVSQQQPHRSRRQGHGAVAPRALGREREHVVQVTER